MKDVPGARTYLVCAASMFSVLIITFDVHNVFITSAYKPKQRERERVKVGSKMDEKDIFFK